MEERILEILKELVAMKSVSYSEKELEPAQWFSDFFKSLPYLRSILKIREYMRFQPILSEERYHTLS